MSCAVSHYQRFSRAMSNLLQLHHSPVQSWKSSTKAIYILLKDVFCTSPEQLVGRTSEFSQYLCKFSSIIQTEFSRIQCSVMYASIYNPNKKLDLPLRHSNMRTLKLSLSSAYVVLYAPKENRQEVTCFYKSQNPHLFMRKILHCKQLMQTTVLLVMKFLLVTLTLKGLILQHCSSLWSTTLILNQKKTCI